MAKTSKKEVKQFACDNCKYFTDKCEHESNIQIILKRRVETIGYKSLEKKEKCKLCLDKD